MSKINPKEPCPCGSGYLFEQCHGPKVRKPTIPEIKETSKLKVIPEPDPNTRTVFFTSPTNTIIFKGNSSNKALLCGKCESVLTVGLADGQVHGIVIQCSKCKSFNEVE